MKKLSQERLQSLLHYNPETGAFTYLTDTKRKKAGDSAGFNSADGYRMIYVDKQLIYVHRLAFIYMTGESPELVDHINGNKADNRWCNLRAATRAQNMHNRKLNKNNTSGVKGLRQNIKTKKWSGLLNSYGKRFYTSSFVNKDDAIEALKQLRESIHGDFAYHATLEPTQTTI